MSAIDPFASVLVEKYGVAGAVAEVLKCGEFNPRMVYGEHKTLLDQMVRDIYARESKLRHSRLHPQLFSGAFMRAYRKRMKMTIKQMAIASGVGTAAINRWEMGHTIPSGPASERMLKNMKQQYIRWGIPFPSTEELLGGNNAKQA